MMMMMMMMMMMILIVQALSKRADVHNGQVQRKRKEARS